MITSKKNNVKERNPKPVQLLEEKKASTNNELQSEEDHNKWTKVNKHRRDKREEVMQESPNVKVPCQNGFEALKGLNDPLVIREKVP